MKKFRINEDEKNNILSMHKTLMSEQLENSTNTEDPNLVKLRNSIKVCIAVNVLSIGWVVLFVN